MPQPNLPLSYHFLYGKNFPDMTIFTRSPLGVLFFLDLKVEVDRTHNPVTKLLMDRGFHGHAIDLHNFIEPVNQRVRRNCFTQTTFIRALCQGPGQLWFSTQGRNNLFGFLNRGNRGTCLTIDRRGDPGFIPFYKLCQISKGVVKSS